MFFVILFSIVVISVNAQRSTPDYPNNPNYVEGPRPYSFNYRSILKDGVGDSSRSESSDGTGKVQGSYSLNNGEGHFRVVEYVADQDGFRAVIRTNEPGTKSMNPANVIMQSESGANEYNPVVHQPAAEKPASPIIKPAVAPEPARAPVSPIIKPAVAREPARAPVRRPEYRRPPTYSGRNPRMNVASGAGLEQNVPKYRRPVMNSAAESAAPILEPEGTLEPVDDRVPIAKVL
ncbi:hypothetical protein AVEN_20302-1 [Araneus ventricosus]|uniref:Cuticle protein 10.9 n=1 Tax=Araneus ventricosus TaxID=182803 RepID=A0A4Y2I9J6_ARAVE|nr:hypothetical protein AVEN_20302-1 [Araneus ventricosus]